MKRKTSFSGQGVAMLLSVFFVVFFVGPVLGDDEPNAPKFWMWQGPPCGNSFSAWDHDKMPRLVWQGAGEGASGAAVANGVCDLIQGRDLVAGNVAICIGEFGMGDWIDYNDNGTPDYPDDDTGNRFWQAPALILHEDDAILGADTGNPDHAYLFQTPWNQAGVTECKAWIEEFICQYKQRQELACDDQNPGTGIPDPSRFHFDSEYAEHVVSNNEDLLDLMMVDPLPLLRWANEPLRGFPVTDIMWDFSGVKLAELWDDYPTAPCSDVPPCPSPPTPGSGCGGSLCYKTWTRWIHSIGMQSYDGALHEAAYDPLESAWPEAKCSNWWTSEKYDGLGQVFTFGQPRPRYRIGYYDDKIDWRYLAWKGSASLQAPFFYHVQANAYDQSYPDFGCDFEDACLNIWRHNLEANINSFGGSHQGAIVPWVMIPGQLDLGMIASKDLIRRCLSMLRAHAIAGEIVVWSSTYGWRQYNQFIDLIDQVWGPDDPEYAIDQGTTPTPPTFDELDHALGDEILIDSDDQTVQVTVTFNVAKLSINEEQGLEWLRVHYETRVSSSSEPVSLDVAVYDGSSFVTQETSMLSQSSTSTILEINFPQEAYLHGDEVNVRFTYSASEGPFQIGIDLVQLVEADLNPCLADLDYSGAISVEDLLALLAAWGYCGDADLDSSGTVDVADLLALLGAWGPCTSTIWVPPTCTPPLPPS